MKYENKSYHWLMGMRADMLDDNPSADTTEIDKWIAIKKAEKNNIPRVDRIGDMLLTAYA